MRCPVPHSCTITLEYYYIVLCICVCTCVSFYDAYVVLLCVYCTMMSVLNILYYLNMAILLCCYLNYSYCYNMCVVN